MSILYSQMANVKEMDSHFCLRSMDYRLSAKRQFFVKPFDKASFITIDENSQRKQEMGYWGLMTSDGIPMTDLNCSDIPQWHSSMEPPKRCLIPATSFATCEPPQWYRLNDELPFQLFGIAGIRFRRKGKQYFLMLTALEHFDGEQEPVRVPLVLLPDEYACWLHAPWDFARQLMKSQVRDKVRFITNPASLVAAM